MASIIILIKKVNCDDEFTNTILLSTLLESNYGCCYILNPGKLFSKYLGYLGYQHFKSAFHLVSMNLHMDKSFLLWQHTCQLTPQWGLTLPFRHQNSSVRITPHPLVHEITAIWDLWLLMTHITHNLVEYSPICKPWGVQRNCTNLSWCHDAIVANRPGPKPSSQPRN